MFRTILEVALGGAVGATARYLTYSAFWRRGVQGFPWATLFVNVAGSFLMSALLVWLQQKDLMRLSPLLLTGILGGFTTFSAFSAFSLDAVRLWEQGAAGQAFAYVAGSVLASILALLLGMALMRGGAG
jgi:CrcB protein